MQSDLVKAGVVTYGFDRVPTYGNLEATLERTRVVQALPRHGRVNAGTVYTVEFSTWATAAATPTFGVCSPEVTHYATAAPIQGYVIFDVGMSGNWAPTIQPSQPQGGRLSNTIVEMRSVHRSLRDKAREEMSEFERKYPW